MPLGERIKRRLRLLSARGYTMYDDGKMRHGDILLTILEQLDKIIGDAPLTPPRVSLPKISHGLTVADVAELIAKQTGVTLHQMKSPSRSRGITEARHLAMYVSRRITRYGITDIGRYFKRHHTSVRHGCNVIQQAVASDSSYRVWVGKLVKEGMRNE